MNVVHALILGLVEGVTEFLPISSTAHMVLASGLLGLTQTDFVKTFEIAIQLGAICAVVFLRFRVLITNNKLLLTVLYAFIPTTILGFVMYKFVKSALLGNMWIAVVALFVGGLALMVFESKRVQKAISSSATGLKVISPRQAVLIGLGQTLAFIPGVSRAAAVIVIAMALGIKRGAAVEFSFLLAVPTMVAATGYDVLKSSTTIAPNQWGLISVGFIAAFISASLAIQAFVKFVSSHTFVAFAWYRIALAVVFGLLLIAG